MAKRVAIAEHGRNQRHRKGFRHWHSFGHQTNANADDENPFCASDFLKKLNFNFFPLF